MTFLPVSGARGAAEPVVDFNGSYRLRFESLANAYRAGASGGDQLLSSRLLLSGKANSEHLFGEIELQDSRAWLDDAGTPLGTDDVNSLEPLQAYAGWREQSDTAELALKVGRFTMDVGSRRLVARNRFRNTLNTFSGLHVVGALHETELAGFYTLPVRRLPTTPNKLDHNTPQIDKSDSESTFWGFHLAKTTPLTPNIELYLFGLDEDDHVAIATRNRNFLTVGGRLAAIRDFEQWSYELEVAYQFGKMRSSTSASNTTDLDHRAYFLHAHIAYQMRDRFSSRWMVQLDYASGDKDPTDEKSNHFDTLFGARRFEFGPTSIYGALTRGNILSSSLGLDLRQSSSLEGFIAYRPVWLAEKRDALTAGGVRDLSGDSGSFVGHQLEARVRLRFRSQWQGELGVALLAKGEFLKSATNAPATGNTSYWYSQLSYSF